MMALVRILKTVVHVPLTMTTSQILVTLGELFVHQGNIKFTGFTKGILTCRN